MRGSAEGWQEELPCIWVLAGVLSYRLCDREYDCENCELFHALRGEREGGTGRAPSAASVPTRVVEATVDGRVNSYVCRLTSGCKLHLDRSYCPCHLWLYPARADQVVIGLDGHVLRVLNPLSDIVLPRVGVWLKRTEPCGWVTRGRISITLHAPISGEVEAVNEAYAERLRVEGRADNGDEWLLRVKPHEALEDVPGLYRGEEALAWYLEKVHVLKGYLRESLTGGVDPSVGITLNDGGEANLDLEQVLGCQQFEALVGELFKRQI